MRVALYFCDNRDGMVVIGMRMLCREGWIGLLEIDLISVSLFGRVVGDVVMVVSSLWWLVRGCGVVIMVLNWNCRDCDCVLGPHGVGVLGSCDHGLLFHVWLWFLLGCICFDTCFVVKRVLWFWTIREIWVIYSLCVDQSYEVIIVEWLWFLILELVL